MGQSVASVRGEGRGQVTPRGEGGRLRAMKSWLSLLAALLLLGCGDDELVVKRPPEPFKVMSFNVLCSLCATPDHDPWEMRLEMFRDVFDRHDPDLLGIQELTPLGDEVGLFLDRLSGHSAIYFAPDDGLSYPDAAIFYRRSRFSVIESGEYWLSPTPDVPNSSGFAKPQLPRLVVWARLKDNAGDRELYFATTHFDNNTPSQAMSAPLVKERTKPFVGTLPVMLVGDFNSKPAVEAFQTLTTDAGDGFAFADTQPLAESWSTISNQDPAPSYDLADRIDHIFVAGDQTTWSVSRWQADLTVYPPNDRYPSDHFPIVAELDYAKR